MYIDIPARKERVGLELCGLEPLASRYVNLYVGQEGGARARRKKKNLIRFCPVGARYGACPLKKLRLDYEAGDSPGGEPDIIVFLASVGVKDNRRIPTIFRNGVRSE